MKNLLIKYRLLLLWLVGCVIIVLRRPDMFLYPQFWAEDYSVFYDEVIEYGWHSLFIPYAGYFHLIPRTVTWFAFQLSEGLGMGITLMPTIMNLCAIAISSICAIAVCTSRFRWMENLYFRMLLSLLILAFPSAPEIFGSITNSQWWLSLLEFFLIWDMLQNRKIPGWLEMALLCIIILTTPYGVILFPAIALCYFYVHKTKFTADIYKVLLILALTIIQVIAILTMRESLHDRSVIDIFVGFFKLVFVKLFAHFLFGMDKVGGITDIMSNFKWLIVVHCCIWSGILFFSRGLLKKLYIPFSFVVLTITFMTISLAGADPTNTRYFLTPCVFIVIILMYEFQEHLKNKQTKFRWIKTTWFVLIFSSIFASYVHSFTQPPFPNYDWKNKSLLFDPKGNTTFFFQHTLGGMIGIPSSCKSDDYIPQNMAKVSINQDCIISTHDITYKDNLYTVSGTYPEVIFQLPVSVVAMSYLCIDFTCPLEIKERFAYIGFEEEDGTLHSLPWDYHFRLKTNNLIETKELLKNIQIKRIHLRFEKLPQDFSFEIKRFEVYSVFSPSAASATPPPPQYPSLRR